MAKSQKYAAVRFRIQSKIASPEDFPDLLFSIDFIQNLRGACLRYQFKKP